jgi:hypothetical protein
MAICGARQKPDFTTSPDYLYQLTILFHSYVTSENLRVEKHDGTVRQLLVFADR